RPSTPTPAAVIGPMPVIATRAGARPLPLCAWSAMTGLRERAAFGLGGDARKRALRDGADEVWRDDVAPGERADERPRRPAPRVCDANHRTAVRRLEA